MRFSLCLALVTVALLGGCSTGGQSATQAIGPDAQSQEAALEIVWEGLYGMDRESRPPLTWFHGCIADKLHVVVTPECWGEQATPAIGVELQWIGPRISDSLFSKGLDAWHGYLMNGKFVEWDLARVDESQRDLIAAGL